MPIPIPPSEIRSELPTPPVEELRKQFEETLGHEPKSDQEALFAYEMGYL